MNVYFNRLWAKLVQIREVICSGSCRANREYNSAEQKETIQLYDEQSDTCMVIITIHNFSATMAVEDMKDIIQGKEVIT